MIGHSAEDGSIPGSDAAGGAIQELEPMLGLSGHDAYCHVCWEPVYSCWVAKEAPDAKRCAFGPYTAQTCPSAQGAAARSADLIKMREMGLFDTASPIHHGYEAAGEVSPNLKAKAQGEGGQRKTPPCTAGLPEVAEQNWPEAQSSPTPSGIKIRIDEPFTQATPYDKTLTPTTPPDGEGRHD